MGGCLTYLPMYHFIKHKKIGESSKTIALDMKISKRRENRYGNIILKLVKNQLLAKNWADRKNRLIQKRLK